MFFGLRLVDYVWLRADNHSLRVRLADLSSEMAKSRTELEAARDADKEIRALLRLSAPAAQKGVPAEPPRLAQAGPSGSGGPAPADRALCSGSSGSLPARREDPMRSDLADLRRSAESA